MELICLGILIGLLLAVILAHSCDFMGGTAEKVRAVLFGGGGGGPQEPD